MHSLFSFIGVLGLIGWVYLAFFNGRFWQILVAEPAVEPADWPSIDIVIPARNEVDLLPKCLPSLLAQDYPGAWRVLLIDDHSTDGTGTTARQIALNSPQGSRLAVVAAPDVPQGWNGKVAAMHAGVTQSSAEYILFTDADIAHPHNSLRLLVSRAVEKKLDLASLMVKLHCESTAEKLLIPPFVFFFAMLYPFGRAADPDSHVAAAAGGVMLVKRKALHNIGGMKTIRSALIDDCMLAKAIKRSGGGEATEGLIELTMSPAVKSLRTYAHVADVRRMVARTAYTQLGHGPKRLVACIGGMLLLYVAPPLLPLTGWALATETSLAAWLIMTILYLPMVNFYRLPLVWALTLPVAAIIYILATIDSARLYWQGKGGQWKDRVQAT
jgi:hopene-associated glycosyltransferase HpnB